MALNPPYFFWVFFVFVFSSLFFWFLIEKLFLRIKKGILCIFLCLPLSLFSLLGPPPFSISLSLSLSLSLSCFFLSSFLSVSHFCIWFLICFVLRAFLFQDVILFLFFCLLSFLLNHNISFFALHLVFYCCCSLFLLLWSFVIF